MSRVSTRRQGLRNSVRAMGAMACGGRDPGERPEEEQIPVAGRGLLGWGCFPGLPLLPWPLGAL